MDSYKVVLLGDSTVGKTSLAFRIKYDKFESFCQPTIGCEFFSHTYVKDGTAIKFMVWDTAGQETFRAFTPQFTRGAELVLIVYDASNVPSNESLESWLHLAPASADVLIVPTKKDLIPSLSDDPLPIELKDVENPSRELLFSRPVSAKTGENIDELMGQAFDILHARRAIHFEKVFIATNAKTNHDWDTCCRI